MKLNFEVILATDLESGDIFYCTPCYELNEFGEDFALTGTDQIFIMDDYYEEDDDDNYAVLVNGGWRIWFKPGEKVVRLGHYRNLIRIIEMVEEGNPEMDLGPNDIMTELELIKEVVPELDVDLLSRLNLKKDSKEDSENPLKKKDEDDQLPF